MSGWGLTFAQSLLKLSGRVLEPEKIYQNNTNVSNLAPHCPAFNIFVVLRYCLYHYSWVDVSIIYVRLRFEIVMGKYEVFLMAS